ncbi:MAG: HD domain-containing phosphohydrolase [Gammaproteobacteria bacterium]
MTSLPNSSKAYLTPNEVAELLMVSPVTVRSWAQRGLLVAKVTPGGHRRFLKADVDRFARESGVSQADARSSATRILVVEDEAGMASYIQDILENSGIGFETDIARNDFEAGVKVHSFSPDVILLDFMPPGVDGMRICSLIKSEPATRHIRVIAIVADMNSEKVSRILNAGADTFLVRPFNTQDLLGILSHTAGVNKGGASGEPQPAGGSGPFDEGTDNSETLLLSLTQLAEAKSGSMGSHDAPRLSIMAELFGRSLGRLGREELQALRNACVLHDIGNLGVPDSILLKPAPLTEEEWTVMRSHTIIGAQLCSGLKDMALTVPIIRSHHERWDGSGYPDGLKGEAIPLLARVFQFVDIFDALSSPRPYKSALSFDEVIDIIRQEIANGWLDPYLGKAFLELVMSKPGEFNTNPAV